MLSSVSKRVIKYTVVLLYRNTCAWNQIDKCDYRSIQTITMHSTTTIMPKIGSVGSSSVRRGIVDKYQVKF